MRVLRTVSGVAVLLNAVHMTHFIQHFYVLDTAHTPAFWFGMTAAAIVDLFSILGGILLLRSSRTGGVRGASSRAEKPS